MKLRAVRSLLFVGVLAIVAVVGTPRQAEAGTITVSYGLSGVSVDVLGAWVGGTGSVTVTVSAFRSGPTATFGAISGATATASIFGGPTHGAPGAATYWSVPTVALPSIMGGFTGLNPAGTKIYGSLFFGPTPIPTVAYSVNAVAFNSHGYGSGFYSGFFGVFGMGASAGSGSGGACFDVSAGFGPCKTLAPFGPVYAPTPSVPAYGAARGFGALGPEVGRTVAIEAVPEPGTALLLGLGLGGMAWAGRRARR